MTTRCAPTPKGFLGSSSEAFELGGCRTLTRRRISSPPPRRRRRGGGGADGGGGGGGGGEPPAVPEEALPAALEGGAPPRARGGARRAAPAKGSQAAALAGCARRRGGAGELSRRRSDGGDLREVAAEHERNHEIDEALAAYQYGLKHCESHERAARHREAAAARGDLDAAQAQCGADGGRARHDAAQPSPTSCSPSRSGTPRCTTSADARQGAGQLRDDRQDGPALPAAARRGEEGPARRRAADPRAPLEPGFRYCQLLARYQNAAWGDAPGLHFCAARRRGEHAHLDDRDLPQPGERDQLGRPPIDRRSSRATRCARPTSCCRSCHCPAARGALVLHADGVPHAQADRDGGRAAARAPPTRRTTSRRWLPAGT